MIIGLEELRLGYVIDFVAVGQVLDFCRTEIRDELVAIAYTIVIVSPDSPVSCHIVAGNLVALLLPEIVIDSLRAHNLVTSESKGVVRQNLGVAFLKRSIAAVQVLQRILSLKKEIIRSLGLWRNHIEETAGI